jgi:hypothetical protein
MSISDLEVALVEAQGRWKTARNSSSQEDVATARETLLRAQRALFLAKGEETALACAWEIPWETGAPLPHVISSGMSTYLMYVANEPDPEWDGSYVREMRTMDTHRIALVKFIDCYAYQFGGPNDEVLVGHRLWGKGLAPYSAHVISNSRWLADMEHSNKVHPRYHPDKWRTLKHYLLLFHDEQFECLAKGYTIEVLQDSLEHVAELARTRLFERENRLSDSFGDKKVNRISLRTGNND